MDIIIDKPRTKFGFVAHQLENMLVISNEHLLLSRLWVPRVERAQLGALYFVYQKCTKQLATALRNQI